MTSLVLTFTTIFVASFMVLSTIDSEAKENPSKPILLWNRTAPGEKGDIGEEHDTTPKNEEGKPKDGIIRLGNVTRPTITIFRPNKKKDTGASVIVCPGGGYHILAYDLEGTEICQWLNSIGVTGILLKYRVPLRKDLEKHTAPLQDAQRAISMVRHNAKEWGIDSKRIGILGFSAGGHLSAMASTHYDERTYPIVDEADKESCRPDFAFLIYPGYLSDAKNRYEVPSEIKVTAKTPPAFVVMAQDDPVMVENAFAYSIALHKAKVPMELHIYPKGGHGYGMRPSKNTVHTWPKRAEEWMREQGWLKK